MADSPINWPGIAEGVLDALAAGTAFGDRKRKRALGRKRRYGTKGSLSVDLDKALWKDFETEEGGNLLRLVEREVGVDWRGAYRWLEAQGLIKPWKPDGRRRGAHGRGSTRRGATAGRREYGAGRTTAERGSVAASRGGPADGDDDAKRIGLARAIWEATGRVAGSPVEAYLARRGTWPGRSIGRNWPMVPGAVAWIERAALERADRGLLYGNPDRPFPDDAVGAMVVAYLPVGAGFVNPAVPRESLPVAVFVEALVADGWYPAERWRKHRGVKAGAACSIPGNRAGREIALVEGECDGLAVALMARAGLNGLGDVAEVRVVGGSGFEPERAVDEQGRAVLLLPDGPGKDGTAKAAGIAAGCATRLWHVGRRARVLFRSAGDEAGDPAGDLAGLVHERAARFEVEGDVDDAAAEREAWRALLDLPEDSGA